jgi:hypothetical protein
VRYSIGALILLTLVAALVANVWLQRQRCARARAAIEQLEQELKLLNFDEAVVESHTEVCELAIANNPLPSQYYLAAQQRLDELSASDKEIDK